MMNIHQARVVFIAVTVSLIASSAFAEDWPRFRGHRSRSQSADTNLPLKWSDSENIIWKTRLPGPGSSSPVTFGNRIYLTSWSGYGVDGDPETGAREKLSLHVVCIDRATGKVLWDKSRPASDNEQKLTRRIADHGYATPTATCDESGVYAYFGVSGVVAYTPNGEFKWHAETGTKTAGFGCAASPVLYEDLVIVNASIESGTLFAFNKKTGKTVWKDEDIEKAWTTPTIVDVPASDPELVVNRKGVIIGLNPGTGERLWTCEGIQDYVVPCVVADNGVAYCIGGRKNTAIAVRVGGRGDVTETHKLWEVSVGANVTSPVFKDGKLYWASDKGIAVCLDASNGEIINRTRVPTRGRIYASAVMAADRLYVTTRDQGVVVLSANKDFDQLAQNEIKQDDSLWNATPSISNGRILLRSSDTLYCIGLPVK